MSSIMEQMMTEYAEEYAKYKDAVKFIENAKRFNVTTAEACTFLDKTIEDYERAQQIIKKEETQESVPAFA